MYCIWNWVGKKLLEEIIFDELFYFMYFLENGVKIELPQTSPPRLSVPKMELSLFCWVVATSNIFWLKFNRHAEYFFYENLNGLIKFFFTIPVGNSNEFEIHKNHFATKLQIRSQSPIFLLIFTINILICWLLVDSLSSHSCNCILLQCVYTVGCELVSALVGLP